MPSTHQLLVYQQWIREELHRCVQFWLEHGMDWEFGGVMTCLDRGGTVYATDKSVWMQGRCAWTFSYLCSVYGIEDAWLKAAGSCIDFLENHCVNRGKGNRMYFTVTREGKPLRQRRYCFSEAFYVMANAQYGALTNDEVCLQRARDAYELIYKLHHGLMEDPVGMSPKTDPQTRPMRGLANPMIYLNLCAVMRKCDPQNTALYDLRARQCTEEILTLHHKPELQCTLETVGEDGEFLRGTTAGRALNPGHAIECSWFMMEEANYRQDRRLHEQAREIFTFAANRGWDSENEGLLYFVDCLNLPPESYEHDMKLWWPHTELLIASLTAYRDTKDEQYLQWFDRTLKYCRKVFSDPDAGEWYGYLRRDNKPTMPPTKGSTYKGPFHLPRMLIMVDTLLTQLLENTP